MGLLSAVSDRVEGMKVYKLFINESKETHGVVVYIGDGSENADVKAAVDDFLEGEKNKCILLVKYQSDAGTEERMPIAVFDKDRAKYFVGCDVMIRYVKYNGRYVALLADDEMFANTDTVAKRWNRGVFRAVITILKAVLKGI